MKKQIRKPFLRCLMMDKEQVRWTAILRLGGVIILGASFLSFVSTFRLEAQSRTSLEVEKAKLQQEIEQYQQDISEEKKTFERYLNDKTRLFEQKQDELKRVTGEVREKEREINALKRQITVLEVEVRGVDDRNATLLASLRERARKIYGKIDKGIPFDKEQRKSALTSIINDSQSASVNVNEIFNRLVAFLNSEQGMAYDSQVLRSIVSIGGEQRTVDLLRVGRVFFAIDLGEGVYVYARDEKGKFVLREEAPVSFQEEQSIRNMIAMIQGRLPPDLVSITLPATDIVARKR